MRVLHSFLIAAAMAVLAGQSLAESLESKVRAILGTADYEQLDRLIAEAHEEALAERDFTDLRNAYGEVFALANARVYRHLHAWYTDNPRSIYAATALAWAFYERAKLLRGEDAWSRTPEEAREAFHLELTEAKHLLDRARRRRDDFMPALDLAILLKQTHVDERPILPLVDRSLDIAPSEHTIVLALAATRFVWGGDASDIVGICAAMAPRVPEYSTSDCIIEAAMQNPGWDVLDRMALDLLEERPDDPKLSGARFEALTGPWRDRPGAEDTAIAIHSGRLSKRSHIYLYLKDAERIRGAFGNRVYFDEAKANLADVMKQRVAEATHDYRIRLFLIDELEPKLYRGDRERALAEAEEHFTAALQLGGYQSTIWDTGDTLARARYGTQALDDRWPYLSNMIYYSNHSPFALNEVMTRLIWIYYSTDGRMPNYSPQGADAVDPVELREQLSCPMIRVVRLHDELCGEKRTMGCNIGGAPETYRNEIRDLARNAPQCRDVLEADLGQLPFSPVPVGSFVPVRWMLERAHVNN